ncbi:DciA family protein [Streptomyces sp. NPDC056930]|uniref:DciA family protein n=1 Tax=Streptomyces sp. NPDC056930 TaxID=3345967 RepID=UPI003641D789
MAALMDFEQPDWFGQVTDWWSSTVGPDLARHAQPAGFSAEGNLRVICSARPWANQVKIMAAHLLKRLEENRPETLPKVNVLLVVDPPGVPEDVISVWPTLVGADLADQVRPASLSRWGQDLATIAETVQARDLFEQRAAAVLTHLRAMLPDITITWLSPSRLRSVKVLIAASAEFLDVGTVEDALTDLWHDTSQVYGPEHPLWILHTGETPAEQAAQEWANLTLRTLSPRPRVDALPLASVEGDRPDAVARRNEQLRSGGFDLCLAFAAHPDEGLALAELAQGSGIPVRQRLPSPEATS